MKEKVTRNKPSVYTSDLHIRLKKETLDFLKEEGKNVGIYYSKLAREIIEKWQEDKIRTKNKQDDN